MGQDKEEPEKEGIVTGWHWTQKTSKNGNPMIVVKYELLDYGAPRLAEYFLTEHENPHVVRKNQKALLEIMNACGCLMPDTDALSKSPAPVKVWYKKDGEFWRVTRREFEDAPF
jgi:hypothetical protein